MESESDFFSMRSGIAVRRNIEGGIGAAALTALLQIDACEQSSMRCNSGCSLLGSSVRNCKTMRTKLALAVSTAASNL